LNSKKDFKVPNRLEFGTLFTFIKLQDQDYLLLTKSGSCIKGRSIIQIPLSGRTKLAENFYEKMSSFVKVKEKRPSKHVKKQHRGQIQSND
jgi:hypothetical protein